VRFDFPIFRVVFAVIDLMNAAIQTIIDAPTFDRALWERWLIDGDRLAQLTPAEAKILWVFARAADGGGESYWGNARLARAIGYQDSDGSCKSVRRAVRRLVERGLVCITKAGGSGPRDTNTYRIVMPHLHDHPAQRPRHAGASIPAAQPDRRSADGPQPAPLVFLPQGGHCCPPRGALASAKGDTRVPQRVALRSPEKSSSATGAPSARRAGGFGAEAWWDSADATAAAAAVVLVETGWFNRHEAAGLVQHYRPTADQVRVVVANTLAGMARKHNPIANPPGFIRSEVRQGHYDPDPAVERQQRQAAQRARTQDHAVGAARAAEQREADDVRVFLALTPAQREGLRPAALTLLDPGRREYFSRRPPNDPAMRPLIAEAARRAGLAARIEEAER
jgi:hypothetical protein